MSMHNVKANKCKTIEAKQHLECTSEQLHLINNRRFRVCPVFKEDCDNSLGSTLIKMMIDDVRQSGNRQA